VLGVDGAHGGHRRGSGRGWVAWHPKKKAAGRAKVAAGHGVTRGVCRETGGGPDQFVATASGGGGQLGRWPGSVARQGEASAARGSGGVGLRRHVARL
jgi:hypothetical protein